MSFWCWSLCLCFVAIGVSPGLSPGVSLCVSYSGGPSVSPGFSQSGSYYSCYAGETFCRAIAVGKFGGAFWWAILVGHFHTTFRFSTVWRFLLKLYQYILIHFHRLMMN